GLLQLRALPVIPAESLHSGGAYEREIASSSLVVDASGARGFHGCVLPGMPVPAAPAPDHHDSTIRGCHQRSAASERTHRAATATSHHRSNSGVRARTGSIADVIHRYQLSTSAPNFRYAADRSTVRCDLH